MILGGEKRGPIEPVSPRSEKADTAKEAELRLRDLIHQGEKLTKPSVAMEGAKLDAESLQKMSRELPRLIQRTLEKVDSSQVYRTFKLSGSDRVVHDRRDQSEEKIALANKEGKSESIKKESAMPIEGFLIHKGKLAKETEKTYENFLADPSTKMPVPEQQGVLQRFKKLLSRFEETLVKRFEEGEKQAKPLQEGEASFLKKNTKEWKHFFTCFASRTVRKEADLAQIKETFFRGFVEGKGKAVLISDLAHVNGQMEKFVRLRLTAAGQQPGTQFFDRLQPGARVPVQQLQDFLEGKLEYLALRSGEVELPWSKGVEKGKFFDAAAEMMVAGNLATELDQQLKDKVWLKKTGRKRGRGNDLSGEEEVSDESGGAKFVPWWQYGKNPKRVRWGLAAFSFVIAIGILLVLSML